MKKIINYINKNSLLAGIIGTILFIYFLQPILEFFGGLIVIIFKSFSETLYNRIFQEMAVGKPDYDFILLLLLNGVALGLIFSFFISTFSAKKNKDSQEKPKPKKRQIGLGWVRFYMIIFFFSLLGFAAISYVKYSYTQSFEQKIKIITPYIDLYSRDKIISDFSLMKTFDDYKTIMNKIESIASSNSIDLPETKVHWF